MPDNSSDESGAKSAVERRVSAIKVVVLPFGPLKESLGRDRLELALLEGTTVAQLLQRLQIPEQAASSYKVALDGTFKDSDSVLEDGMEVSILPPVSCG